jgi:hypothetical protein
LIHIELVLLMVCSGSSLLQMSSVRQSSKRGSTRVDKKITMRPPQIPAPSSHPPAQRSSSTTSNSSAGSNKSRRPAALRRNLANAGVMLRNVLAGQDNSDHFLPEAVPVERLMQKHRAEINKLTMSHEDVAEVMNDPEQFRKLQQVLRDRGCMTDSYLRIKHNELLRERLHEMEMTPWFRVSKTSTSPIETEKARTQQESPVSVTNFVSVPSEEIKDAVLAESMLDDASDVSYVD